MADKKKNVIRYNGRMHFNIGMVVFLVFFVYILINLILYAVRPRIQIYEVGADSSVM